MKKLFNLKSAVAVALSAVLFTSCMKSEPAPPPEPAAFLAIVNAYSPITTTPLQFTFSGAGSGNLRYGQAFAYSAFTNIKDLTLKVDNPTSNQNLLNNYSLSSLQLEKGYSGYLYGKGMPAKFLLLNDVLSDSTSTSNNPRMRFLNLGEGVEAVDLFIGTDKIASLSNRAPETQANSTVSEKFIISPKAAGPNDIIVRSLDGTLLAELKAYNFANNGRHTIVLRGDKASVGESDEAKAKALVVAVY
ncbi:hypothetical protein ACFSQ3_11000 [Sphingobacterium corticis]|uniref:DUF4397 domain-containing protein n=1 Tax=Sphingobacterium corticis TaxID=1812823 RepID=A0ABW5NKN7_9SPHI